MITPVFPLPADSPANSDCGFAIKGWQKCHILTIEIVIVYYYGTALIRQGKNLLHVHVIEYLQQEGDFMIEHHQLLRRLVPLIVLALIFAASVHSAPPSGAISLRENDPVILNDQAGTSGKAAESPSIALARGDYQGRLTIYVAEPTGRWLDNGETLPVRPPKPFGNAVIGYAYDADVFISESFNLTFDWDAAAAGFDDITEDNIKVVAAIFNAEAHPKEFTVQGGSSLMFNAHYVDASAQATSGNPGSNYSDANYTHTVFVEEDAATW